MNTRQAPARSRRSRLGLWLGAGALLTTGAVFGGVRAYQSYIVHLNVNGVEQVHQVQPGADGTALVSVPMAGGGQARILVGPENVGSDGAIHASISIQPAPTTVTDQTLVIKKIGPADEPK